jgi:hypothetical protein
VLLLVVAEDRGVTGRRRRAGKARAGLLVAAKGTVGEVETLKLVRVVKCILSGRRKASAKRGQLHHDRVMLR